jgi:hypothetical protein
MVKKLNLTGPESTSWELGGRAWDWEREWEKPWGNMLQTTQRMTALIGVDRDEELDEKVSQ